MDMTAIWREFAGAAGTWVVSALWQGTVLALGLALCLRLTPRISAADRFRVWAAGFAALAALPFLPALALLLHSAFWINPAASAAGVAGTASAPAWLNLNPRWGMAIAAVWIAASLARAVEFAVHAVRLRGLWKWAAPIASQAKRRGRFEVCTTRELDRPSVIGFFAPRILIPEWLLEQLTPAELEQVILHEAEHLRRRDDWMNLAQKLCLVAFPLNPALAWMERRLCREREMACDEGVVRRTRAPRAYAACLASLADRGLERRVEALSLGAWRRRPELAERVHRILRRRPGLHPAAARAVVGVVGCGLALGSVELARCPQLVAFAARPAAQQDMADAVIRPVDADGNALRGLRAVNAVARVPSRDELAEMRAGTSSQAGRSVAAQSDFKTADSSTRLPRRSRLAQDDGEARQASIAGTRSAQAKTAGPADNDETRTAANASSEAGQQVIVFTAWEQVESTIPDSGAGQTGSSSRVIRRFAITRLVLRVAPSAAKNKNTATGSPAKPAPKTPVFTAIPLAPLPAAMPIRDGWLVIQL